MIDSTKIPPEGTWRYRFSKWFTDNINWCHGAYYNEYDEQGNPVDKPDNKIYNFFYKYWLWPYIQTDCICCNTVRGVIYGVVIGWVMGKII